MEQYKIGIIGATGMVGQRFVTLLENHPWFRLTVIAASASRSSQRTIRGSIPSSSRPAATAPAKPIKTPSAPAGT
mgnify:CR=1 FL=1